MIRIKPTLFLILSLPVFILPHYTKLKAQDMDIVKKTIEDLCSAGFAGRGYSNNGDSIASTYIADLLKKNKITAFDGNYFQPFPIPVNTFPGKIKVAINDSLLIPGYDFLVCPTSGSIEGKYPIIVLNHQMVDFPDRLNKLSKEAISTSFLLIDTSQVKNKGFKDSYKDIIENNLFGAKGIIDIEHNNLSYRPSIISKTFPTIKLHKNSIPDSLKILSVHIENRHFKQYKTRNVIGYIKGEIDSFIVFTAHYDHLGEMGKGVYFPGANDNASGVAMVLELSRYFAKNKKKLKYSLAFIFLSAEEMGLLGSFYYVNNPVFPLSQIKFLINLDMIGSGDKGIKVVNGTEHKREFDKLVSLNATNNYLPEVGIRGPAANSDHYPFHQKGVKSFFIYTMGEYSEYHNIYDTPKALPLSKFKEIFNLLVDFTHSAH
jgi:aminopeptidase YwaD